MLYHFSHAFFFNYQIKTMEASNSLLCVNKHYEQYTSKLLAISKPLSPKQTKTYTHAYFHCINISFHEQH